MPLKDAWTTLIVADLYHREGLQVLHALHKEQTEHAKSSPVRRGRSPSPAEDTAQGKLLERSVEAQTKAGIAMSNAHTLFCAVLHEQRAKLPAPSTDIAWTCHRLGSTVLHLGQLRSALEFYKEAYSARLKLSGPEDKKTGFSLFAIEALEEHLSPKSLRPGPMTGTYRLKAYLRGMWQGVSSVQS